MVDCSGRFLYGIPDVFLDDRIKIFMNNTTYENLSILHFGIGITIGIGIAIGIDCFLLYPLKE